MSKGTCTVEGCERPLLARGYCSLHYQRARHGWDMDNMDRPPRIIRDDRARWWQYVDKNGPVPEGRPELGACWLWTGAISGGYGNFRYKRGGHAHRVGYELFVAELTPDLVVDHLCRNPICVNFEAHLEAISQTENVRRGRSGSELAARNTSKTQCPQGHPYNEENTYVTPTGSRNCRACRRIRDRNRKRSRGCGFDSGQEVGSDRSSRHLRPPGRRRRSG